MRAIAAVALCLFLGACATFGGGGFDPYGMYDIVSVNGEDWTGNPEMNGWYELRSDGTSTVTFDITAMPDLEPSHAEFTLGEMEDGCMPFTSTSDEGPPWTGAICGDVLTTVGDNESGEHLVVVMHRRR